MMDAVMYGMMPRAKIVKRRRLPPLNRSKIPSTRQLMPGVGMCAPMRYTASSARVNNTLFRKSGMRKRFRNASMNLFITWPCFVSLRYHLERAARFGDLFLGGGAEGMRVNGDLAGQLAVTENFDTLGFAANKPMRAEQLRRH